MSRRILLVLSLFLGLVTPAAAAGLKAIVTDVNQPASVSQDGIKYKKIKKGTALFTGDVIRTGETGRVAIRFVDGTQAAIAANTDVSLRRLTPREDPVKTTMSLLRGSLRALVKKLSTRSSFEVETYNTVVAVKGTDFEVGVATDKDGKKKTVATCFETQGKGLEVSGLDRKNPVTVGAGQSSTNRGDRPEAASILRASDLKKALEKYRALSLSSIPPATGHENDKPPVEPTAEEKKAQEAFDAAARQSEAALGAYLDALDKGDLDAQAKAQSQLEGLRETTEKMEDSLTSQEEAVQKKLDEIKAQGPAGDATQQQLLEAQLSDIKELQEALKEVALQTKLEAQADAAQGNLFMDRDGYRVQINSQVLRPTADVVQKVTYSKRSAGPNTGVTEFQHLVTFNKAINGDWVPVYERPLNDPLNLAGGSPEYWRTDDVQKTFSPGGDCVCLHTVLYTPSDALSAGTYKQARDEYFQAAGAFGGLAQGMRKIQLDQSIDVAASDNIQVTATDLGNGLRLSYDNLGTAGGYGGPTAYVGNIFSVDINLPGATRAINAASLGNSFYSLATADLSGIGGTTAFQLSFSSPAYPGRVVSPLLGKDAFKDAFREGWR